MRHEVVLPRSRPGEDRHEAAAVPEVLRVEGRTMTLPEARSWPERCPGCGYHEATQGCACKGTLRFRPGVAEKAAGIARAESAADPDERARIDAAIRKVAARGEVFSANDVRPLIPGVHGPLVGARFNAAAKAGAIVRVGYEPSTKGNTHAHPIATWSAA